MARRQTVTVAGADHDVSSNVALYLDAAHAESTIKAYDSDMAEFERWCRTKKLSPLPASAATVAEYLAELASGAGARKTTVARRLTSINHAHRTVGHIPPGNHPLVANVMRGIRRSDDSDPDKAAPLTVDLLRRCVTHLAGTPVQQARDRAVLCVGFAGALRRSELVEVHTDRMQPIAGRGTLITITSSKTDQEHQGQTVALTPTTDPAIDPLDALDRWFEVADIDGYVFRGLKRNGRPRSTPMHPTTVNQIVKDAVQRCGIDPGPYSGHSMRAGYVTSARDAGIADHVIMATTRHRDARTLDVYTRHEELFETAATLAGW
jgi:site-specific recombinase XerD